MDAVKSALIIGNSDGIGLGLTRRLLDLGWQVCGLSRSAGPIRHDRYRQVVVDVTSDQFREALTNAVSDRPDLCVYCAGVGRELDLDDLAGQRPVFLVNLVGAVTTFEAILPPMLARGDGHIIVLSSIADELLNPHAPGYSASKAGLTSYVESLALAVRKTGVAITNVRFGFVDTKMARGDVRPMMMSVDQAVDHLLRCMARKPIRFSRPRTMTLLVRFLRLAARLRM